MTEPFFVEQSQHDDEGAARAWLQASADRARLEGATWLRSSWSEELPGLVLVEGWKRRPKIEGAPRWSIKEAT